MGPSRKLGPLQGLGPSRGAEAGAITGAEAGALAITVDVAGSSRGLGPSWGLGLWTSQGPCLGPIQGLGLPITAVFDGDSVRREIGTKVLGKLKDL